MNLPILLGNLDGNEQYLDLQTAPHLLVAGGTKQERDAFLMQAAASLCTNERPREVECRLLGPQLKDWPASQDIKTCLDNLQKELDSRYSQNPITTRPFIVALIDGINNDTSPKIVHLASLGRAVGIHLILSVQEISKKTITGMIKAAFPARIAFRTETEAASRLILDAAGAELLSGDAMIISYSVL
jgi:S-DNA-T family DNA segregation ATPase FtsK/SpoIIIE